MLQKYVNNIKSTHVLAKFACSFNVKKFILISSDKAVRPTNYMGVSKRISELICQAYTRNFQQYHFSIVIGNVLGSSGSVFPRFNNKSYPAGHLQLHIPISPVIS